jgi:hypothetical protein
MVKRKITIWQTMINKTLHRKQNIWLVMEAVSRRRTDNTIVKRKITIWQTMINNTLHRKQNIWLVIEAVSRRRTDNTMVKRKMQYDKQWLTKHYTENRTSD